MTIFQTRRSAVSIDRVRGLITLQEEQKRGQWKNSLPRPLQNKMEILARRAVVLLTKTIPSPAVHKRMTGKYFIDVFGGSGFLSKATDHLGRRGYVLETKFGPR